MVGLGAGHNFKSDALIEAGEAAALAGGQGQQVGIGDLAWAKQPVPADQPLLQQADRLRPERMAGMAAGFCQACGHQGGRLRLG